MAIKLQNMCSNPDDPFRMATKWMWRVALHEYGYPMHLVVLCGRCNWLVTGLDAERKIVCDCGKVHLAPSDPEELNALWVYPDMQFVTLKPSAEQKQTVHTGEPVPPDAQSWRQMIVERFLKFGDQIEPLGHA